MSSEITPDYPHVDATHVRWRSIELYGITGWFADSILLGWKTVTNAIAFGGYLKRSTEDSSIVGELIDRIGGATIQGSLTDRELEFTKHYIFSGHKLPIKYSFRKEDQLWVGRYQLSGEEGGKAVCQLNLFHTNAFGIISRY